MENGPNTQHINSITDLDGADVEMLGPETVTTLDRQIKQKFPPTYSEDNDRNNMFNFLLIGQYVVV